MRAPRPSRLRHCWGRIEAIVVSVRRVGLHCNILPQCAIRAKDQDAVIGGDNGRPPGAESHGLRLCPRRQHQLGRHQGHRDPGRRQAGDKQADHRYDTRNHGDHQDDHQGF